MIRASEIKTLNIKPDLSSAIGGNSNFPPLSNSLQKPSEPQQLTCLQPSGRSNSPLQPLELQVPGTLYSPAIGAVIGATGLKFPIQVRLVIPLFSHRTCCPAPAPHLYLSALVSPYPESRGAAQHISNLQDL